MADLRTDYIDDVLDPSMGGKRRYEQTENADGTVTLTDKTTYLTIGSDFGADDLNETNDAVNKLSDSLTANGNSIVMDYHDGKYGINTSAERGADTFIPFSTKFELLYENPEGNNCRNWSDRTLSLDLSGYDGIAIYGMYVWDNYPSYTDYLLFPREIWQYTQCYSHNSYGRFLYISDSGITFAPYHNRTDLNIPLKIYGIKNLVI